MYGANSHSMLATKCRKCRYVLTCDHKMMEADAYIKGPLLLDASEPLLSNISQPMLVKHDYRDIKVAEGTIITIDLEEVKEQIARSFYPSFLRECT